MKFIRLIIISAAIFFLLATVFSLFIPSHITISRATNIAPGADSVLLQIADLNNWKKWHPQFGNIELKDAVIHNGRATSAVVNGVQLSVIHFTDSLVIVQMKKGATPVNNNWKLIKHGPTDSLTLQNYIQFDFDWYPWEKFSSLMLEGSYGPAMEKGLANLKAGL